jgi:hypothetical protein
MGTIVYQYGTPYWAEPGPVVGEQLRLANRLWNSLVEIEHAHRERVANIWLRYTEVQEAQKKVDLASEESAEAKEELNAYRKALRTTAPGPEVKARIKAASETLKVAREEFKAAKAASGDRAKAELSENKKRYYEEQKAAGQAAVSNGLYWGTSNDILRRRFPGAVERAYAPGSRWGELRFHRFDGTGTLTTQIMWQASKPKAYPSVLHGGSSPWKNVFSLKPAGDGHDKHGVLRLRVGGKEGKEVISIPVIIHRPLPEDAEVKEVKLSRRKVGGNYRLYVAVVINVPDPEPKTSGDTLDIDFRWTSEAGTGIKVARVSSFSGTLPEPPADIASLVTKGDFHEVWIPNTWRAVYDRDSAIRSDRDALLEDHKKVLADALRADPELAAALGSADRETGELVPLRADRVMKWRSAGKLAYITIRLRDLPEYAALTEQLELWRRRDRHLWEYESNERDQVIARRNDAYSKVAAWLADSADYIGIKELPVASLKKKSEVAEDTYEARGSRSNVQFAAPSELKTRIINAAKQRGVPVETYRLAAE